MIPLSFTCGSRLKFTLARLPLKSEAASEASLLTSGRSRRAESANWEATFVYELQSNLLGTRGYAKRCENARGAKRQTNEPHRYHGCKFGTGVNVVLDNYLQTKRGVVE